MILRTLLMFELESLKLNEYDIDSTLIGRQQITNVIGKRPWNELSSDLEISNANSNFKRMKQSALRFRVRRTSGLHA